MVGRKKEQRTPDSGPDTSRDLVKIFQLEHRIRISLEPKNPSCKRVAALEKLLYTPIAIFLVMEGTTVIQFTNIWSRPRRVNDKTRKI